MANYFGWQTNQNVGTTICLNLLLRCDDPYVTRCLDSAKPIITCLSVFDVGATEETVKITRSWALENKVEYAVNREPFIDEGQSRNRALESCRKNFPKASYILFLDPDMVIDISDKFSVSSLNKDCYYIFHEDYDEQNNYLSDIRWLHLVKNDRNWKCLGPVREFWDRGVSKPEKLPVEMIKVRCYNVGRFTGDVLEKEKNILLEFINVPNLHPRYKVRYSFYLGNILFNLGQNEGAIEWFKKRIELGGWEEEIFMSLYTMGLCYENMKNFPMAKYYYQEAWQTRRTRNEPLMRLVDLYEKEQKDNMAIIFIIEMLKNHYPKDDILFVNRQCYDSFWIDFSVSVNCYYHPDYRQMGKEAQKKLMNNLASLPAFLASKVKENNKHYLVA